MQTTPATILGQISAEKTKISERLARLNADRETIATQLTDLEATERVLTRVGTTSPARRTRSASAREAKTSDAERGGQRQPRAAASKSAGRQAGARTASLASAFLPSRPAKPEENYTRHAPAIARTMSGWRYSAISARGGSRSAKANSMRYRRQRSWKLQ
jgi:hypothetical protein